MNRRSDEFRIAVLASLVLAAMLLLAGKLWYVQVARGEEYTSRLRNSSQVSVRLPAVRGEIIDRNGIPLARTIRAYAIWVKPEKILGDRRKLAQDLAAIFPDTAEEEFYAKLTSKQPSNKETNEAEINHNIVFPPIRPTARISPS